MTISESKFGSLAALEQQLASVAAGNLREAFEQGVAPATGVDYRRLFPVGSSDEALSEISPELFARVDPHPYITLGATYATYSPFHIRQGVLQRLEQAQRTLRSERPGWSILVFDALRPLAVQDFMVRHTFEQLARDRGFPDGVPDQDKAEAIWNEVFSIWARPVQDPSLPPPHSTGAALDITLLDENGSPVDMGSAIDTFGAVSLPSHFAHASSRLERIYHTHRTLLNTVMTEAGFQRHPFEWWHFSYGDQLWALMCWLDDPGLCQTPVYGGLG